MWARGRRNWRSKTYMRCWRSVWRPRPIVPGRHPFTGIAAASNFCSRSPSRCLSLAIHNSVQNLLLFWRADCSHPILPRLPLAEKSRHAQGHTSGRSAAPLHDSVMISPKLGRQGGLVRCSETSRSRHRYPRVGRHCTCLATFSSCLPMEPLIVNLKFPLPRTASFFC
jgi:hypothetical protein